MRIRYVCEKGNIAGRGRGCRQNLYRGKKKTSDNAGGKLHAVSHFNTTHLVLRTTPKTLEPQ